MEQYSKTNIDEILKDLETVVIKNMPVQSQEEYIKFEYTPEGNIIWNIENNEELNTEYGQLKKKVESVVKQCHQILYSNGSIVGVKALNDIVRILLLKFLETQFRDESSEIWKIINEENLQINCGPEFDTYINLCRDIKNFEEEDFKFNTWEGLVGDFLNKILPTYFKKKISHLI